MNSNSQENRKDQLWSFWSGLGHPSPPLLPKTHPSTQTTLPTPK